MPNSLRRHTGNGASWLISTKAGHKVFIRGRPADVEVYVQSARIQNVTDARRCHKQVLIWRDMS